MSDSSATKFIAPGATLGVMGGGQLARMFVHAAQRLGYATAVLDPDPDSPAGWVAHHHIRADYLDAQGLVQLAELSAAITTEFENVPASALAQLAERLARPAPRRPDVEQHRLLHRGGDQFGFEVLDGNVGHGRGSGRRREAVGRGREMAPRRLQFKFISTWSEP
jgi:hypothetical protein